MPDEYLPPNKILFLQNLPESVNKEQLLALFTQSVQNFKYGDHCSCICSLKVSEPARSSSYSNKEGHRIRGVYGRGKRKRCEGRAPQLQAGRREQNQGDFSASLLFVSTAKDAFLRSLSPESNHIHSCTDGIITHYIVIFTFCFREHNIGCPVREDDER